MNSVIGKNAKFDKRETRLHVEENSSNLLPNYDLT